MATDPNGATGFLQGKAAGTMFAIRSGGCQCGAVRYEIEGEPTVVYACHCRECQRQSGSAFAMAMVVPHEQFRITRGKPKSFARTAESGRRVVGWFCPECGTRLYHTPGNLGQNCNVKPGTLDDTSWLRPSVHCWTRSKQPWVMLAADAATYETQPEDRSWLLPPTTKVPPGSLSSKRSCGEDRKQPGLQKI